MNNQKDSFLGDYKELFINIDSFDENRMRYSKPISFYKVSRNMGIYYIKKLVDFKDTSSDGKNFKKQKIIVQSPKMVVPFGIKEFDNKGKKSFQMSLSFYTMTNLYNEDEIKKFYNFVKRIDVVNEETIMTHSREWGLPRNMKYKKTLQKLSEDFPCHMNITLPYDEKFGFLFNVYDEHANKSNIDIIEKKSIVSVVIELTDLKFSEEEFRSNWTVMQIRKFGPCSPIQDFFMSGCFICDEDNPEDLAFSRLIEKYKQTLKTPINIPNIPQMNPNHMDQMQFLTSLLQNLGMTANSNPIIRQNVTSSDISGNHKLNGFKPPSLEELLKAKKSLNKTKTVVKGTNVNGNKEEYIYDANVPAPPPVQNTKTSKKSPQKHNSEKNKSSRRKKNVKK